MMRLSTLIDCYKVENLTRLSYLAVDNCGFTLSELGQQSTKAAWVIEVLPSLLLREANQSSYCDVTQCSVS